MFQGRIVTTQELKEAHVQEFEAIDEVPTKTRVQKCVDVNGGHLLDTVKKP